MKSEGPNEIAYAKLINAQNSGMLLTMIGSMGFMIAGYVWLVGLVCRFGWDSSVWLGLVGLVCRFGWVLVGLVGRGWLLFGRLARLRRPAPLESVVRARASAGARRLPFDGAGGPLAPHARRGSVQLAWSPSVDFMSLGHAAMFDTPPPLPPLSVCGATTTATKVRHV